ncbi:MAG: RDD family protein, partial [Rickettsiales bacterium]
ACRQLEGGIGEIVFTVIIMVFYTVFLSSRWRATPGMRLTKIEAVGADGAPLSKAHALYWCIASSLFACLAFAPILYLNWWMQHYGVMEMIAAMQSGQIDPATFSMELQVKTGLNAMQMQGMFIVSLLMTAALCLVWALSIVLSKRKIGFHNWLAATRFVVRTSA